MFEDLFQQVSQINLIWTSVLLVNTIGIELVVLNDSVLKRESGVNPELTRSGK